eukprot:scaffold57402_cov15-Tisochrysis_lutea.AAC.1
MRVHVCMCAMSTLWASERAHLSHRIGALPLCLKELFHTPFSSCSANSRRGLEQPQPGNMHRAVQWTEWTESVDIRRSCRRECVPSKMMHECWVAAHAAMASS